MERLNGRTHDDRATDRWRPATRSTLYLLAVLTLTGAACDDETIVSPTAPSAISQSATPAAADPVNASSGENTMFNGVEIEIPT